MEDEDRIFFIGLFVLVAVVSAWIYVSHMHDTTRADRVVFWFDN